MLITRVKVVSNALFGRAEWAHFSGTAILASQASHCVFPLVLDPWPPSDLHGSTVFHFLNGL